MAESVEEFLVEPSWWNLQIEMLQNSLEGTLEEVPRWNFCWNLRKIFQGESSNETHGEPSKELLKESPEETPGVIFREGIPNGQSWMNCMEEILLQSLKVTHRQLMKESANCTPRETHRWRSLKIFWGNYWSNLQMQFPRSLDESAGAMSKRNSWGTLEMNFC